MKVKFSYFIISILMVAAILGLIRAILFEGFEERHSFLMSVISGAVTAWLSFYLAEVLQKKFDKK